MRVYEFRVPLVQESMWALERPLSTAAFCWDGGDEQGGSGDGHDVLIPLVIVMIVHPC